MERPPWCTCLLCPHHLHRGGGGSFRYRSATQETPLALTVHVVRQSTVEGVEQPWRPLIRFGKRNSCCFFGQSPFFHESSRSKSGSDRRKSEVPLSAPPPNPHTVFLCQPSTARRQRRPPSCLSSPCLSSPRLPASPRKLNNITYSALCGSPLLGRYH